MQPVKLRTEFPGLKIEGPDATFMCRSTSKSATEPPLRAKAAVSSYLPAFSKELSNC